MYKLILLLTLSINIGFSSNYNDIYKKITTLHPKIEKTLAQSLSKKIDKYSKIYKINPMLAVAIAKQESGLNPNNHRRQTALVYDKQCDEKRCKMSYTTVSAITDVGLFQFHVKTMEAYNIDPILAKSDLEYQVKTFFELMKSKIKVCSHLKEDAWVCYHSKTPSHRENYKKLVSRFL